MTTTRRLAFITREGQRARRWEFVLLLVAVVLVTLLVAAEFASEQARSFTRDRPITSSIISSLVLSLFAIGVIELIRKRNESRRWHGASAVLRSGITNDLRHVRDALIGLSTGEEPYDERLVLANRHALDLTGLALNRTGSYPCRLCRSADRIETLERLMGDQQWVQSTFSNLRDMGSWYRERVAVWMLNSAPTQVAWDYVQSFAEVSNALEELLRPMYPVHRNSSGAVQTAYRSVAAEAWEQVIVGTIIVEELARRAGSHDPYTGRVQQSGGAKGGGEGADAGQASPAAGRSSTPPPASEVLEAKSSATWGSTARHLITATSQRKLAGFDLSVEQLKGHLRHSGLRTESSSKAWPRRWAQSHTCGPDNDACPTAAEIWKNEEGGGGS